MTAAWASAKLSPPHLIGEYVGSSGEMSPGRFQVLDFIYRVSSFLSFFSIWITTDYFNEQLQRERSWCHSILDFAFNTEICQGC